MLLVLVFWLFSSGHHGSHLIVPCNLHLPTQSSPALMLVLDVSVQGWITEITLSTTTYVVTLHWVVSCPTFTLVLYHLVTLVIPIFLHDFMHRC